ncbi:hypothetical protein ACFQHW_01695 [Lapidilactobacillus achengensis]|uniref:Helicase XPB/Ssl2 N-terminal domain-containing protein n=1 Tax=Lapidilactobacillus achengensis TaxID=2486000 RepID=A0ABW1UK26_9LACO|nr:hypothetical protein [Lapidilactobacillus achengensis]
MLAESGAVHEFAVRWYEQLLTAGAGLTWVRPFTQAVQDLAATAVLPKPGTYLALFAPDQSPWTGERLIARLDQLTAPLLLDGLVRFTTELPRLVTVTGLPVEQQQWLLLALNQLALLTAPAIRRAADQPLQQAALQDWLFGAYGVVRFGQASALTLVVNDFGYRPLANPGTVVEQRLDFTSEGQVQLRYYDYLTRQVGPSKIWRLRSPQLATVLTAFFDQAVSWTPGPTSGDLVGMWHLAVRTATGDGWQFSGWLQLDSAGHVLDLATLLSGAAVQRRSLATPTVPIPTKISCVYQRHFKPTRARPVFLQELPRYTDCWETFEFDGTAGTFTWLLQLDQVQQRITFTEATAVQTFLKELTSADLKIAAPPVTAMIPADFGDFELTIAWSDQTEQRRQGPLVGAQLPAGWDRFAAWLDDQHLTLPRTELFDFHNVCRAWPLPGELLICWVIFNAGGRQYMYQATDVSLVATDLVLVPAGVLNHPKVAVITKLESRSPEQLAYPIAKLKQVIGRYQEQSPPG